MRFRKSFFFHRLGALEPFTAVLLLQLVLCVWADVSELMQQTCSHPLLQATKGARQTTVGEDLANILLRLRTALWSGLPRRAHRFAFHQNFVEQPLHHPVEAGVGVWRRGPFGRGCQP